MNHEKLLLRALEAAQEIEESRHHKHVSIVMRKKNVIAVGTNKRHTHPLSVIYGYRNNEVHSELDALRKIPSNLRNDLILINYRFGPTGNLKLARPCNLCMPWCREVFDKIYYSTTQGMVRDV